MRPAIPAVAQERWLALADRYPALRAAVDAGRTGGWKTASLLSRCLLFVLGLVAASMAGATFALVPVARLLVAGAALLAVAESLISRRRVLHAGLEEALWLCGVLALALQLALWAEGPTFVGVLLVAVALALAGWRLLNALLVCAAVLTLSLAIALLGENRDWAVSGLAGCLCCVIAGIAAFLLSTRTMARPSHDRMLDALLLVMPPAASLWLLIDEQPLAPLLAMAGILACFVAGIARRNHALLFATLLQVPCLAWALRNALPLSPHWLLMIWGALVLAVAVGVERGLRGARSGLSSRRLDAALPQWLQTAGVAAQATPQTAEAVQSVEGQGGGFGGGGASGRF